jgi:hypothetical protein
MWAGTAITLCRILTLSVAASGIYRSVIKGA